jgi:hypothetical protein
VVPAEPLDQHAHHGRAQARLGDRALGEDLPEVAVHVGDAVLGRNLREVGDPVDAPGLLELRPARGPLTADEPEGGMVDDEVELRPVAGGLAHVAHVGIGDEVGESLRRRHRIEPLVHADVDEPGLDQLLVERVQQLLVVHAPE